MTAEGKYQPVSGIKNLVKEYTESTYKIDRYYRYFYFYFDKLEDTTQFEKIRELVENIYTNEYLNRITVNWNNELADSKWRNRTYVAERFLCKAHQLLKG